MGAPGYPVREAKRAICAESNEIVRRDGFGFACPLEEDQLRENGDRLEDFGESPEELQDGVSMGAEKGPESEKDRDSNEVFNAECVDGRIICRPDCTRARGKEGPECDELDGDVPKPNFHEKDNVEAGAEEEDFHGNDVSSERSIEEQVEVPRDENDDIEGLRFEREAC